MSEIRRSNGYSAMVILNLETGDRTIPLHQIGPGSLWLREPIDLAPCDATIVMHVDGHEDRWPVYLPDGLSTTSHSARTLPCEEQETNDAS